MIVKEFWIRQHPHGYYEVMFGKRIISTADTLHEAEQDIEKYNIDIQTCIDTGVMTDWRTAVFFS